MLSDLILQIYRAARETPADEYQDFVLGLVKSLVPFTSSRWMTIELAGNRAIMHSSHLQNEPADIALDWESISRKDRLMYTAMSNPGKAFGIHSDTFFAGREYAEVRDYLRRYRHGNILSIAVLAAKPEYRHAISLYRADRHEHFDKSNEKLLEQLFPHLVEALAQNRLLALRQAGRAGDVPEQGNVAIARYDGQLYFAGSGFNRLLREEWPEWKGIKLPSALLVALTRPGGTGFSGAAITVSASRIGDLVFLRAAQCCPLIRLSSRETQVAKLYGQGLSHKEIAQQINVSPVTARNFIQRIYIKLGISDKAELAALISRSGHFV